MARNFVVKVPSPVENRSLTIPFACARGTAVFRDGSDSTKAAIAYGLGFAGFVTKKVTVAGPQTQLEYESVVPGYYLEVDGTVNDAVTITEATEVEVEGTELIMTSGTQAITVATAIHTPLTFQAGKFAVNNVSGTQTYYSLEAILTPETANALRILAVRV